MKKIQKYWGIALIVMLLASMLVMASPAAAGDLTFTYQPGPSGAAGVLQLVAANHDVLDMAIASDGTTIYSINGTNLFKSTNAGVTWTASVPTVLGVGPLTDMIKVAVAPDNTNLVVVASEDTVYISENGGASWDDAELANTVNVKDVDIAPATGAIQYIVVAGNDGGGDAYLGYLNIGVTLPSWTDAIDDWTGPSANGTEEINAIAISPNFASDYTMLAVSNNGTGANTAVFLEQVNFNSFKWNTFGTPYPVAIESAASSVDAADIAMAPDYLGSDEALRINFVTLALDEADGFLARFNDGVFNQASTFTGFSSGLNSVAFDGTNLVAGAYQTNDVYRSAAPMASFPQVLPARTNKKVGLNAPATGTDNVADKVLVGFSGANVVAAKSGANSCFSVSRDLGVTFNDISLVDSAMTNVVDFAVSPDGANRYIVSNDNTDTSVWRLKDGAWERVLIVAGNDNYIARPAPDNMDAIYVAAKDSSTILYSAEAGDTRWYERASSGAIADIAVENANIIYVGSGSSIYKSTNGGFTWGPPSKAANFSDTVYSIKSLSAGNILVSGIDGAVQYSSDGGATWTYIAAANPGEPAFVDASGLAAGDSIFAVSATTSTIYRWVIGTNIVTWDQMNPTGLPAANDSVDVALVNGVLYSFSANTTPASSMARTLNPNMPANLLFATEWDVEPVATSTGTNLPLPGTLPDTVKVTNDNTFWFYSNAIPAGLYSYKDTFAPAAAAPVLSAPANDYLVPVNVSGTAAGTTFYWSQVAGAKGYQFEISLDQAFLQKVSNLCSNEMFAFKVIDTGALTPGVTYYWRVRANAPVYSNWSEVWAIRVQPSQAMVPNLSSPVNGGTIDMTSPGFSWTPITGATSYKFEVSTNAAFATTIYTDEVFTAGAQLPITIELEQGKQYFWRVKALAPTEGDWSTVGNFFVNAEVTTTAAPTQPQITITTQPAPTIILPEQTVTTFTVAPPVTEEITPAWIWAIIVIGAILVIAMIVLIVRTRRSV